MSTGVRFEVFSDVHAWWCRLHDAQDRVVLVLGPCAAAQRCVERIVDVKRATMTMQCLRPRSIGRTGFAFTVEDAAGEVLATSTAYGSEMERDRAMDGVRLLAQSAAVVMRDGDGRAANEAS